jgi:hypothetical protein
MTKRQKLKKVLIEMKWQRIKEHFGSIDSIEMEKEVKIINELKSKLPEDCRRNICRPSL